MRIEPLDPLLSGIPFKADNDGNIFGKPDLTSDAWVNSTDQYEDMINWKAFCQPLLQDTFEKVKQVKQKEQEND